MNCGKALPVEGTESMEQNTSPGKALYFVTGQTIISIIVLYLLREIFLGLSFVQDLHITGLNITTPMIVSTLMYLLILVLLVIFARSLGYLWPQAFPRYSGLGAVITSVVYVISLSIIYTMLKPIFLRYISEPEPLIYLCILLALVALFLLGRAGVVVYQSLPAWLDNLRTSVITPPMKSIDRVG
jgi:hypothetical protein